MSYKDEYINDVDLNDLNKIYKTRNFGDIKIVKILGVYGTSKHKKAEIEFLNTGNRKVVEIRHIKDGYIRDDMKGIDFNKEYDSIKFGKFKILRMVESLNESRRAEIQFLNTGAIRIARLDHILTGNVADPTFGSAHKVAKYGDLNVDYYEYKWLYNIWNSMISRCYNEKDINYKSYGAKGVKVCDRWLTYSNFFEDIQKLPGWENKLLYPDLYQLDKDYLQLNIPKHKRVYSPETCIFIHKDDNHNIMMLENFNKVYVGIMNNTVHVIQLPIGNDSVYSYYDDLYAARSAYNYYNPTANSCNYMKPDEFIKHRLYAKEMCTIIN